MRGLQFSGDHGPVVALQLGGQRQGICIPSGMAGVDLQTLSQRAGGTRLARTISSLEIEENKR